MLAVEMGVIQLHKLNVMDYFIVVKYRSGDVYVLFTISTQLYFRMLKPLMVSLFSAVFLVLAYRIHVVLQRSLPPDLPELEKLRWLDELGRVAMSTVKTSSIFLRHLLSESYYTCHF